MAPPVPQLDRVAVVGSSGAGKSTVARALAARDGLRHLELDAVFQQPGWRPLPVEEFRARVAAVVSEDRWVTDGNYLAVRDLVWRRATSVVWLDLPRRTVVRRVVVRTLRRFVTREELWNGNRERLGDALRLWDAERSVIGNAWQVYAQRREEVLASLAAPEHAHLEVVRLTSPGEVADWLAGTDVRSRRREGGGGPRSRARGG